MKVALVSSQQDAAGRNIRRHIEALLDDNGGRIPLHNRTYEFFETEGRLIHAEGIDAGIDCDLVIFLSRHASTQPVPVLTVHVTGNFREAGLGGAPRTLAPAAPAMMHAVLRALARHCPEGYRVAYEVTHHGPTAIVHPSFFVEIGSTVREWEDPVAGRAVAEAVLDAVMIDAVPLIGFGGTHYAVRQTEIALSTRGAFGHIAHTREAATLDPAMIRGMIGQSGAVAAYIDRKALKTEDYNRLVTMLDAVPLMRLSESEISALGRLPWDMYRAVRLTAEQESGNARCFIHSFEGDNPPVPVRIDPVLLESAVRADEPALIRELDALPVVHIATQDNRMLPLFVTDEKHASGIINALNTLCVKIIRSKEITATEKDQLIITRTRFDPEKARGLGIGPGPAYRQLAAGRNVEIGGRTITPAMVCSRSDVTIRIPGLEKDS